MRKQIADDRLARQERARGIGGGEPSNQERARVLGVGEPSNQAKACSDAGAKSEPKQSDLCRVQVCVCVWRCGGVEGVRHVGG